MQAKLAALEYFLPEKEVSNADLAVEFSAAAVNKIAKMTGIVERHVAGNDECASDLAVCAAQRLFQSGVCKPDEIDFILFCTQSPDYYLPTTACLLQERLGIATTAGAFDFNLGSSGYVYGLGIAQGLIATGQASRVLLLTAETYSKYLNARDRSVRTVFGDGATASLLTAVESCDPLIGPFVYGTNGSGGPSLIVPSGGARLRRTSETATIGEPDEAGNFRSQDDLYMNGGEIFNFTIEVAPKSVQSLLDKAHCKLEDIDLFVFHQANEYILEHLRRRIGIAAERFQVTISHCGNTCSSTIPIALKHAEIEGRLRENMLVMLVGFGPGLSWGSTLLRWSGPAACSQQSGSGN